MLLLYLILRHSNPMAFLNSHLLCPQPTTLSLLVVIYSWSHPCSCGPQASPGSVHSREWHGHLYLLCLFHQSLGRQELWELGARHCHCWTEWSSAPEGIGVRWVGGSLSVYKVKVELTWILYITFNLGYRKNISHVSMSLTWQEGLTRKAHFCSY